MPGAWSKPSGPMFESGYKIPTGLNSPGHEAERARFSVARESGHSAQNHDTKVQPTDNVPTEGSAAKKVWNKKASFFFVLQEGKENRGETRREVSSARRLRRGRGGAPPRSDGTYEAGRSPGHREAEGKPLRSPNNIKLFTLCIRAASR